MSISIDIFPFICYAIGKNKKLYKTIDKLYQLKDKIYHKAAKESKYYDHLLLNEGTLLTDEYAKKALGIAEMAFINEEDAKIFMDIIKEGWPYVYTYVANIKNIDFDEFLKRFIKKHKGLSNISDTELIDNGIVLLFFVLNSEWLFGEKRTIKEDDDGLNVLLDYCAHYIEVVKKINILGTYETLKGSKETNKIFTKLKQRAMEYLKISSTALPAITMSPKVKQIYEDISGFLDLARLDAEIINTVDFSENDFEHILLMFYVMYYKKMKGRVKENEIFHFDFTNEIVSSMKFDNLEYFISFSILIKVLTKLYNEAKSHYFENVDILMLNDNKGWAACVEEMLENNKKLTEENERLKEEINVKDIQIRKLKEEKRRLEESMHELKKLREFLFSMSSQDEFEYTVNDNIDQSIFYNKSILLIGGPQKWGSQIIDYFDDISDCKINHIPGDMINFDTKIFDSYKYIFLITKGISHSMYYKVIENLNENNNLYLLSFTNKDRIVSYIYQKIKEDVNYNVIA